MNQKTWQYITIVLLVAVFILLVFTLLQFKKQARECVLNPEAYIIERMAKANEAGVMCVCKTDSYPEASKEWYSKDYKFSNIDFSKFTNLSE